MKNTKVKIVVYSKTKFQSVVGVLDTIIGMAGTVGLLILNHTYLGGNGWLDFAFVIMLFVWLIEAGGKFKYTFYDIPTAVRYLKESNE